MPSTLTYPGVYIEEIPSGVRTITGVPTSIAAFVGRARRGPVDEPRTINSYADFERVYGGRWDQSLLGYAVADFFLNGGGQAIVVRMFHGEDGAGAKPSKASLDAKGLGLEAAYEGSWANGLRARIDHDVADAVATALGVAKADLFNLTIRDTNTGDTEQFRNLTVKQGVRQADRVLLAESLLMRVKGDLSDAVPDAHADDPPAGKTVWEDDSTSTGVADDAAASDGGALVEDDFTGDGKQAGKEGLFALDKADLFNLLCIPPYTATGDVDTSLVGAAAVYCERRRAMLLVDPPSTWTNKDAAKGGVGNVGTSSKNAALFFPRLRQRDPERGNQIGDFVPCGAVAGVCARTDTERGVWKAPAGLAAVLVNVPELAVTLTDAENGELNPLGVNCLRSMPPAGRVVWGSRTLQGDDRLGSEWKYVPVRRTALYIEESLYRGTQWVVFEPNDEPLWASIRLNIGAFMHNLFRQGAFQGTTPQQAYFVKCDRETTTQNDINLGVVNIVVGFAPLKPAEFVVIKLQQIAGQIEA
jgi:phage tail sheath protein FI